MKYNHRFTSNGEFFFIWSERNSKQLPNGFNFYGAFTLDPLYHFIPTKISVMNFYVHELMDTLNWWNEPNPRLIKGFENADGHLKAPDKVAAIKNENQHLLVQYTDEINKIDQQIYNVIKVWAYEAEQIILDNYNDTQQIKKLNSIIEFVGDLATRVRVFQNFKYSPPEIGEMDTKFTKSLKDGISYLLPKKEPLLKDYAILLERHFVFSRALMLHLLDKPVNEVSENLIIDTTLPAPEKIASKYYNSIKDKQRRYTKKDAQPVMEITQNYLIKNSEIKTIYGYVTKIISKCGDLKGGKDAKASWIKFYAAEAGLKNCN